MLCGYQIGLQLAAARFETVATKRKQEEKPIMRKLFRSWAALGALYPPAPLVSADPSLVSHSQGVQRENTGR